MNHNDHVQSIIVAFGALVLYYRQSKQGMHVLKKVKEETNRVPYLLKEQWKKESEKTKPK